MNYVKHIFECGDILYASYLNDMANAIEAVSTQIIVSEETDTSLSPTNNEEYRYGSLTSLTLILPTDIPDDYAVWVVFSSGAEATAIDYPETIKWSGDDVLDGVFVPVEKQVYNIGLWYDGFNINGIARGVSI